MQLKEAKNTLDILHGRLCPANKRRFAEIFCVDYSLSVRDCEKALRSPRESFIEFVRGDWVDPRTGKFFYQPTDLTTAENILWLKEVVEY